MTEPDAAWLNDRARDIIRWEAEADHLDGEACAFEHCPADC
jgi:hypothetical protein